MSGLLACILWQTGNLEMATREDAQARSSRPHRYRAGARTLLLMVPSVETETDPAFCNQEEKGENRKKKKKQNRKTQDVPNPENTALSPGATCPARKAVCPQEENEHLHVSRVSTLCIVSTEREEASRGRRAERATTAAAAPPRRAAHQPGGVDSHRQSPDEGCQEDTSACSGGGKAAGV